MGPDDIFSIMNALHEEGLVRSSDGLMLFTQSWRIPRNARGTVLIVHGYGEHSGRHAWLAERLNEVGFSVHAFDHRGHGKSEGLRAFIADFQMLLDDVDRVVSSIDDKTNLILMGQSMGSGILAHYLGTRKPQAAGAVLCSGMLKAPVSYPAPIRWISALSSKLLPGLFLPELIYKLDTTALSRSEAVVKEYEKDPFVYHGKMLNRTGWQLYVGADTVKKIADKITVPLLLMHGSGDRICPIAGAEQVLEMAASSDKTLKAYPDAYHELFNDLCSDEALADLLTWLDKQIPQA